MIGEFPSPNDEKRYNSYNNGSIDFIFRICVSYMVAQVALAPLVKWGIPLPKNQKTLYLCSCFVDFDETLYVGSV